MGPRRDDCTLWLLVHTMTVTEVDYQVRAQFIHAVLGNSLGPGTRLLSRRIRMCVRPNRCGGKGNACRLNSSGLRAVLKRNSASVKHHLITMQVDSCSSIKSSPPPSQAITPPDPVVSSLKQQSQQPIVQVVAPLQQLHTSSELPKRATPSARCDQRIKVTTTNEQVMAWLMQNGFQKFREVFQNYNGQDMLRLSKNDVLQLCGEVDGIRFFNVLHEKAMTPRLRIYVCKPNAKVFHAVFLASASKEDLKLELCNIVGIHPDQVQEVFMEGPNDIHIIVSDSVVNHMKEESAFTIFTKKDKDQYVLLLKLTK